MKCPCEQCISFAICSAKLKAFMPNVSQYSEIRKCHDLREYLGIDVTNRRRLYQDQINTTRKLYGLTPMRDVNED